MSNITHVLIRIRPEIKRQYKLHCVRKGISMTEDLLKHITDVSARDNVEGDPEREIVEEAVAD